MGQQHEDDGWFREFAKLNHRYHMQNFMSLGLPFLYLETSVASEVDSNSFASVLDKRSRALYVPPSYGFLVSRKSKAG